MKIRELVSIVEGEVVYGEDFLDNEVFTACGSDMMSDVLAFVKEQAVMLTGLVNPQVVRTAEMMDMKCIVFVRGKRPDMSMIELAEERDIVLFDLKSSYPISRIESIDNFERLFNQNKLNIQQAPKEIIEPQKINFKITDDINLSDGNLREKYQKNIQAIKLLI